MSETNKTVVVKVRRISSLLKGHQGIDNLGLGDAKLTIAVAENVLKIQDVADQLILEQEKIQEEVIGKHQTNLATPNQQVKLNPEAEIRNRLVNRGNEDVELYLNEIPAPALFEGESKPVPGLIAALMPVLSDLDKVSLSESLQ